MYILSQFEKWKINLERQGRSHMTCGVAKKLKKKKKRQKYM